MLGRSSPRAWKKESASYSRRDSASADHFTASLYAPAEVQLADRAVAMLERVYWRIGTALYTYPTDVITVALYTREQFRADITQSPEWAGACSMAASACRSPGAKPEHVNEAGQRVLAYRVHPHVHRAARY